MRTASRLVLALVLISGIATVALASARLPFDPAQLPRPEPGTWGIHTVHDSSRIAALGIGTGRGLTMGDSFVFLDWDDSSDIFTTSPYWCEGETLFLLGAMFTPRSQPVTASVNIKDGTGAVLADDSYTFVPEPSALTFIVYPIGELPVLGGLTTGYKVTFKFKQGASAVGQSYWTAVLPGSEVICMPVAAKD